MIPQYIAIFDAWLSLLGALGLYPVVNRLIKNPKPNPLELRLKWISIFMFLLYIVRFPFIVFDIRFFGGLTYTCATLMSFSVFLYFETLLRRHMPLWLKIFVTLGSIYFIGIAMADMMAGQREPLIKYGFYLIILQLSVILISLFRNRDEYNKIENSLIDLSVISLLSLAPFFLSDISSYGFKYLPKLGVIGGLLFVYTSMYNQSILQNQGFLLKKLLKAVFFSFILTLVLAQLTQSHDPYILYRSFVLFLAVNLIFRIHFAVKTLDGDDDFVRFVEKVNESQKHDFNRFMKSMHIFFDKVDKKLLRPEALTQYNTENIKFVFNKNNTHLFSIYDLKENISDKNLSTSLSHQELEAFEHLVDLLEKYEMTYICKLGESNPAFILFHVPMISYSSMVYRQTMLISEFAKVIESKN